MKSIATLLLFASLGINAVLAVMVWSRRDEAAAVSVPMPAEASAAASAKRAGDRAVADESGHPLAAAAPTLWAQLESEDIETVVQRLQGSGFPPLHVRSVVRALLSHRQANARELLVGPPNEIPYWKTTYQEPTDPKIEAELRALSVKTRLLWQKYADPPEMLRYDEEMRLMAERRYGALPIDKLISVAKAEDDYHAKMIALFERHGDDATQIAVTEARALELRRELDARVTAVLAPEEAHEFQLRNSSLANSLRSTLETFRPSEAEYKAIFAAYSRVERMYPSFSSDEAQWRARIDAMTAARASLQPLLGAERLAELEQAEKTGSDKTTRLLARLDLPLTKVGEIDAVQKDLMGRAAAIRANGQLSPEDRQRELAALANQARERLTASLGEKGYAAYRDLKGEWILSLGEAKPAR